MQPKNKITPARLLDGTLIQSKPEFVESTIEPVKNIILRNNVVSGLAHQDAIENALTSIATVIGRTLGPHGSHALVCSSDLLPGFGTKDGHTVLQHLSYVQETASMVLEHTRTLTRKLVRSVGDGSTSVVVMASCLYSSLQKYHVLNLFPPGTVKIAVLELAKIIVDRIKKAAVPANNEKISIVAATSANNDPWLGELISNIYLEHGKDVSILVDMANDDITRVIPTPGYRIARGMVHECFANQIGVHETAPSATILEKPAIMVINDIVNQEFFVKRLAPVMNHFLMLGRSYVLVAREINNEVIQNISRFKLENPNAPILFVDHAGLTRKAKGRLGDLAVSVGGSIIGSRTTSESVSMLHSDIQACGHANSVRATTNETVFIIDERLDAAIQRANELQDLILELNANGDINKDEMYELESRIRMLTGTEVVLSVGAPTQQERKTNCYIIEDAVLAASAALRSGVVEGLGLTGLRFLLANGNTAETSEAFDPFVGVLQERMCLPNEDILQLATTVIQAFVDAYYLAASTVLDNAKLDGHKIVSDCIAQKIAFNVITNNYKPYLEADVLSPTATDIEVILGAAGLVSLLVSSNQTILTRPAAGIGLD